MSEKKKMENTKIEGKIEKKKKLIGIPTQLGADPKKFRAVRCESRPPEINPNYASRVCLSLKYIQGLFNR